MILRVAPRSLRSLIGHWPPGDLPLFVNTPVQEELHVSTLLFAASANARLRYRS
jgi:hypothetical protein